MPAIKLHAARCLNFATLENAPAAVTSRRLNVLSLPTASTWARTRPGLHRRRKPLPEELLAWLRVRARHPSADVPLATSTERAGHQHRTGTGRSSGEFCPGGSRRYCPNRPPAGVLTGVETDPAQAVPVDQQPATAASTKPLILARIIWRILLADLVEDATTRADDLGFRRTPRC